MIGLSTAGLGESKSSQKFVIDQDYEPKQVVSADNDADINASETELRSGEDTSTIKEPDETQNSQKSIKNNTQKENNDKDYSNTDNQSSVDSSKSQENEHIESKNESGSSEEIDISDYEISGEIIHSEQKSENLDGFQDLVSEQSREKFGISINKNIINGDAVNVQVDGQKNNENTSAQNGTENVSNTLIKGQNNTITESELENGKESIFDNKAKGSVTDEKTPVLNSDLIKENSKELLSKTKSDEAGIKETFSATKNLDNRQSNVSQEIMESSKIKESVNSLNDIKGDSVEQKIDTTNIQISTGQTNSHSELSTDNEKTSNIDQMILNNTFVTEQGNNSAGDVKADSQVQQGVSENISVNVGKQILESIQGSINQQGGEKQITVNLNPPELGQVSIKFQEHGTEMSGLLEVNKAQTRSEIEQALPQIIRDLSDSGINIKRLEVVLTSDGQTGQEEMRDETLFYNQQQQQDLNNPSMYRGNGDTNKFHEWMANQIDSVNNHGLGDSISVENSINILI
jgi:hypothetical protein